MARIRSIKPEFWSNAQIASLPKATALFFIALWNFADDQGIVEDDSRSLALRIPIYRSQDVHKMLNALWQAGLIKRSAVHGLVLVTGWAHQKIDKPRDGKWKNKDIEWITYSSAPKSREPSANIRRKDRIGEDRSGSDRIVATTSREADAAPSESSRVWSAYSKAYLEKYGVEPIRNAKSNSLIKAFVGRVPAGEGVGIAEFYLSHGEYYYVKNRHPLGVMLRDAEKLRTEWVTGKKSTHAEAKGSEQQQGFMSQLDRIANGTL